MIGYGREAFASAGFERTSVMVKFGFPVVRYASGKTMTNHIDVNIDLDLGPLAGNRTGRLTRTHDDRSKPNSNNL
jgi:hypothetical protein